MELDAIRWIDLLFLLLFLRILYISAAKRLVFEVMKFLGAFVATFFAFQFYPQPAKSLAWISSKPPAYVSLISFFLIFFCFLMAFHFLAKIVWLMFRKGEDHPRVEKWIGFFLGMGRGALLCSVLAFSLSLTPAQDKIQLRGAFSKLFKNVAPQVYFFSFRSFYKQVNPAAEVNKEVQDYYEAD